MVKSSYRSTNKRFQDSFQKFAGTKTKKGDLLANYGDEITGTGYLVKIEMDKVNYPQRGWYVNLDGSIYRCYNQNFNGTYPEGTLTASKKFLIFKNSTIQAEIFINKKQDIYRIDKINDPSGNNLVFNDNGVVNINSNEGISMSNEKNSTSLNMSSNIELLNSDASLSVNDNHISISGDLIVNDNNLSAEHQINTDILNSNIMIPGSDSEDYIDGITLNDLVKDYKKLKEELKKLKED